MCVRHFAFYFSVVISSHLQGGLNGVNRERYMDVLKRQVTTYKDKLFEWHSLIFGEKVRGIQMTSSGGTCCTTFVLQ